MVLVAVEGDSGAGVADAPERMISPRARRVPAKRRESRMSLFSADSVPERRDMDEQGFAIWGRDSSSNPAPCHGVLWRDVDLNRLAKTIDRTMQVVAELQRQLVRPGRQLHVDGRVALPEVHP